MTLEVRKARISDSDLPSVIAQSANGELVANLNLPSGSGWGPFKYVPCGSRDLWDLRWRKEDGEYEHVKMISPTEKWLLNLKLTSDSKLANSQLLVDTAKQIVFCDISREIKRGEVVINLPKIMGTVVKEQSPTAGFVCPYCGIAFTKATTLQAHVGQYCRKRPSPPNHLDGAPIKRCRSTSPPDEAPTLFPAVLLDRKSEGLASQPPPGLGACPPLPPHHGLSPSVPLSPSLLPGAAAAAAAAAQLTPLKYCIQCRLFFANDELFQMHLRLGANLNALSGHGLVLSAPVITSTGLQYIPVHGAASLSPQPPPPASRGAIMPEEVSVAAAVSAATNGALSGMIDGNCSPSLPLDLSFRGHGALSPPSAALHCLSKKSTSGPPKRQLSEAELAAIPRPFQCQFCQTRFRSVKTLRAHQESYCQGGARVEMTRGGGKVGRITSAAAAAAAAKAVSAANAVTAIIPTLAAQLRPACDVDLEGCWHQTDHGFRCYLCGYVGQTVRGMKLHSKLHRQPQPTDVVTAMVSQNSTESQPALETLSEADQAPEGEAEPDLGGVPEGSESPTLSTGGSAPGRFKCRACDTVCASLELLLEHMRVDCPQPGTPVKKEVIEHDSSE